MPDGLDAIHFYHADADDVDYDNDDCDDDGDCDAGAGHYDGHVYRYGDSDDGASTNSNIYNNTQINEGTTILLLRSTQIRVVMTMAALFMITLVMIRMMVISD